MQALLDAGVYPNDGLLPALRARHSDIVRLLISSGVTPGPEHEKAIKSLSQKKREEMGLL